MKENKLILMARNLQRLEETVDQLIREVIRTQNMTIGTLEVIKRMEGYEEAVETLKKENQKESKKNN
jgi:low affinity Fe/Cu permease